LARENKPAAHKRADDLHGMHEPVTLVVRQFFLEKWSLMMKHLCCASTLLSLLLLTVSLLAADHRVEPLNDGPPADAVAAPIAALLNSSGAKVLRGESRTLCDIWLCKELSTASGERPASVNYPFAPGSLIGVVKFPRKGSDFRDQDVASGVYTLRYGQQPVDGAHVGTSPTRDFVLLLPADKDTSAAPLDYANMTKLSSAAAGSNHPLLLSLQRPGDADGKLVIRHDETNDWWILRLSGKTKAATVPLDLVVAGHAEK
jgi:hypothetical protein